MHSVGAKLAKELKPRHRRRIQVEQHNVRRFYRYAFILSTNRCQRSEPVAHVDDTIGYVHALESAQYRFKVDLIVLEP